MDQTQALDLLLQLHGKAGPAVEKLLPRSLNPKIKEQLETAMNPAESPPNPAQSASIRDAQSEVFHTDDNLDKGHDRDLCLGAQRMSQQQEGKCRSRCTLWPSS